MIRNNDLNFELLKKNLAKFKINPRNWSYYVEALTHPSYSNEHKTGYDYQKLEFLGDAAISWIISNFLYKMNLTEGEMSLNKSNIVNGKMLARCAKEFFDLEKLVLKGNGFKDVTDKVLEDLFEAFIGAIYKDQGIKKVSQILDMTIIKMFEEHKINLDKPNKSKIQEYFTKNEGNLTKKNITNNIQYRSIQLSDGRWNAKLFFNNICYGDGIGQTKKEAEENAAEQALSKVAQ